MALKRNRAYPVQEKGESHAAALPCADVSGIRNRITQAFEAVWSVGSDRQIAE